MFLKCYNTQIKMFAKSFQEITSNIKNTITRTQLEIMTDDDKKVI